MSNREVVHFEYLKKGAIPVVETLYRHEVAEHPHPRAHDKMKHNSSTRKGIHDTTYLCLLMTVRSRLIDRTTNGSLSVEA